MIPPNEGDPAEVTVTNGPAGMSYKLQEGFVILDGARLASTFSGMVTRMGSPKLTAPCFRGKILKRADTSFTCDVQSGDAVVGYVTTHVTGRSGDVTMDYEPIAKAAPNAGGTGALDGTYACLTSQYQWRPSGGPLVQYVPSPRPRFTISGGSYTSGGNAGMIRTSGQVVSFLGGAYDGWQGVLGSNSTGRYILLRDDDHGNARPGVGAKIGDHHRYVQK